MASAGGAIEEAGGKRQEAPFSILHSILSFAIRHSPILQMQPGARNYVMVYDNYEKTEVSINGESQVTQAK